MTVERQPWCPPTTVRCFDDLLSYRLVGASACADRITTALVHLAHAANHSGRDVAIEVKNVGDSFCRLKPDTGLHFNLVAILTAAAQSGNSRDVAECPTALDAYRRHAQKALVTAAADLLRGDSTFLVQDYSSMIMRILAVLGQIDPAR